MSVLSIRPLRKKTAKGVPYVRQPETENTLKKIMELSDEELLNRCSIQLPEIFGYVRTECLVYLVRVKHGSKPRTAERIYKILADRVIRRLPKRKVSDIGSVSLITSNFADEVFYKFIELMGQDCTDYQEKLDFFEVRFDSSLKMLRLDAMRKVARRDGRTDPLENDSETGELLPHHESAVGTTEPFGAAQLERAEYRSRLEPAIDTLPVIQRRILEMTRKGIPIDSKDPEITTIAKVLGKSEKTIRNHRDQAFAALGAILNGGK